MKKMRTFFFLQQYFRYFLSLSIFVLLVFPQLSYAISKLDFNLPSQNIEGWTVLSPEADSRIVYVDSSSGNDGTGHVYSRDESVIGSNPQFPSGTIQAFKTLAAAQARLRHDKPDWMLLKSGQVWEESLSLLRGESATKRAVVSFYGVGDRPELRTGTQRGISSFGASNIIISGIKFWAHTRDTDGPYFNSYVGSAGFFFLTRSVGDRRIVSDVLIENCFFRTYTNNVISGALNTHTLNNAPITRVTIRRSIISGNYSDFSHSQGLFHTSGGQPLSIPATVLLEENIFDHNGWRIQSINSDNNQADGQATIFNHNTYFSNAKKVMFVNNIFMRASSIHNKWTANTGAQSANEVVIENNLYIEGELGISAGGNNPGIHRFSQFKLNNNVMTDIGRGQSTNRNIAWYLDINDWDDGEIIGNLLLNQTANITNAFAMNFTSVDGSRQLSIKENFIYNIESGNSLVNFFDGDNTADIVFTDNVVQAPLNGSIARIDAIGGYQFNGDNGYFSSGDPADWFSINGGKASLAEWINYTGDDNAITEFPNWVDPDRNIERYAGELGLGADINHFITALYNQSKNEWRDDLTAAEINDWFRAGFETRGFQIISPAAGSEVVAGQPFLVKTNLGSQTNVKRVDFWHDNWDHFGVITSPPYEKLMSEALTGDNPHSIRVRVTFTDNRRKDHQIFVNVAENNDTKDFNIISPVDNSDVVVGQPFLVKTNLGSQANVKRVDFWHDNWDHFGVITSPPYEKLMNEALTGNNPHSIRVRVTYNDNSREDRQIFVNVVNGQ